MNTKKIIKNYNIVENYIATMIERFWFWIYRETLTNEKLPYDDWDDADNFCFDLVKYKFSHDEFYKWREKFDNMEKKKTKPKKLVELEKWYLMTKKFGRIVFDFN